MSQDSPSPTKQLQECSNAINVLPHPAEPSPIAEMSLFRLPEALGYNTTPYSLPESEQRATWVYRHEAAYPEVVRSMADDCHLYLYRGVLYNVPVKLAPSAPYYCVTRGQYIGIFNYWNDVMASINGYSTTVFAVTSVEVGVELLHYNIEHGKVILYYN
ncbi:hypothetical protein CY34DRAFT_106914 [Suillus luteus UH-Slu-Lm8-n1]|uniref:Ribonuclease H1 N-terminal domain-containing protein n=1 Tax=Suillus luteus UH-Slu-Lm8-n1 TaxID=930992 RepID=A0A0D0B7G6_9AGAM|nr:hypothetical protein CY34DRAFT_106914 [Suillus luteus UH-Slu-Lm8-n1]